jgi:uncharacterized protein YbbC (DUF1343 family)
MAPATVPGIDRFLDDARFRGSRIGLITNPSGVTSAGVPTWKALLDAGFPLASLFGPEHGFRGQAQDAVELADESFRGVRLYSLYGERQRPTREMLEDLDLMLFDIQDVGCRYYTYLYTLAYCFEACAAAGKPFCVLDRPNPIGALVVEGGPIAAEAASFVGGYGLPARYGLTVGEYALYLQGEYLQGAELEVLRMEGYRRAMFFPETGLPWVAPSPNLPSLETALVYPGTCLFEGTNLSEGRGSTRPFETIGAPWLDGEGLREELAALEIPGATFTSTFFTPTFSKHKNEPCEGVVLHVRDRQAFRPLYTALAMLRAVKIRHPDRFEWRPDWEGNFSFVDRLAGGRYLRDMIDSGAGTKELYARACLDQRRFEETRQRYLVYDS